MKIGQQLKQQRKRMHWSQQELADQLHISRQSISKWEKDTALPSFANVVAISDLFNISIDNLIRGDDALMTQLTTESKWTATEKIIWSAFGLALIGVTLMALFHANFAHVLPWFNFAAELLLIGWLFTIDWKKFNEALSSRSIIIGIVALGLFLMPQLFSFFQGFIEGLRTGR